MNGGGVEQTDADNIGALIGVAALDGADDARVLEALLVLFVFCIIAQFGKAFLSEKSYFYFTTLRIKIQY